jgi:hypothetical protein
VAAAAIELVKHADMLVYPMIVISNPSILLLHHQAALLHADFLQPKSLSRDSGTGDDERWLPCNQVFIYSPIKCSWKLHAPWSSELLLHLGQ